MVFVCGVLVCVYVCVSAGWDGVSEVSSLAAVHDYNTLNEILRCASRTSSSCLLLLLLLLPALRLLRRICCRLVLHVHTRTPHQPVCLSVKIR